MNKVYLHTGSNLGDRADNLRQANELIEARIGRIEQASRIYWTAAWGIEDQPDFLNQALEVRSRLSPEEILAAIGEIEKRMGRVKVVKWGERLIDIDILFYNEEVIGQPGLQIPHPELQNRNFVLAPLLELAPRLLHPLLKKTVRELYQECGDPLEAKVYQGSGGSAEPATINLPHQFITIEGNIGAGKTTLCQKLSDDHGYQLILEQFADNPFLPHFYKNPDRYAFTVELFFMTERHKQLQEELSQRDLFQQAIVSDYIFFKTLLFARHTLSAEEYRLFQRLFNILNASFPKPDLLVYLHRPVPSLLENIKKRGRAYEQEISADYLERVQNAYFDFFKSSSQLPILIIDVEQADFLNNADHYRQVLSFLENKYEVGMHRVAVE